MRIWHQQRKAWDVLTDLYPPCVVCRCGTGGDDDLRAGYRPSDTVWTYTRSNAVMPMRAHRSVTASVRRKDRHNAVEVNWIDPDNGW